MKKVHVLMTPHPRVIASNASIVDAAQEMARFGIGALIAVRQTGGPVREEDVVGIVTDRDIVVRVIARQRDPGITAVAEAMTSQVFGCRESDRIEDAITIMRDQQVRRLVVFDPDRGHLSGILSLDDIAARMGTDIVGDLMRHVAVKRSA